MSEFDYDLFVIGAGSGGVRASRIAASHGAKVAVAEEHRVGTRVGRLDAEILELGEDQFVDPALGRRLPLDFEGVDLDAGPVEGVLKREGVVPRVASTPA